MSDKIKSGKCEHCGQTIQVYKYKITPEQSKKLIEENQ